VCTFFSPPRAKKRYTRIENDWRAKVLSIFRFRSASEKRNTKGRKVPHKRYY
jgi:hypothetical protein